MTPKLKAACVRVGGRGKLEITLDGSASGIPCPGMHSFKWYPLASRYPFGAFWDSDVLARRLDRILLEYFVSSHFPDSAQL